ncbi:MAG: glycoside hydrolase family 92 protein [Labilibaculum sp.]|nr:glycoside hydrolase family 92 protein [Labilibaculum sp.]
MKLQKEINRFLWLTLVILLAWNCHTYAKPSNNQYVNLFIGTSGDHGQCDPGAAVPFGMIRVCPDSQPRSHAGYDYGVSTISGISVNRLSGVGCGGAGGNLSIKPSLPGYNLQLVKETEKAEPGYYMAMLNNGVKTELTATHNIAVERYSFPKHTEAVLSLNLAASFERFIKEEHEVIGDNELEGYIVCANVCGRGQYKLYFNLTSNKHFKVKREVNKRLVMEFEDGNAKSVEIRIAVSSVSQTAARKENELTWKKSFSQIKNQAKHLWAEKLGKVEVKGGKEEDQIIFYTSLYRALLSPANVTSSDNQYFGTDGKVHQTEGSTYYSSWSLWDTFRTKFPLLVILEPAVMKNITNSLVRLYLSGKENWSTSFEATPTVRTEHAVVLLLDAYKKGIKGIDFNVCYQQLCNEAAELPMNSPDQKLEATIDLWALAQIADIIGKKEDAGKYQDRSEQLFIDTWKNEFMNIDSGYSKMRDNGLYQGTRWQYRWALPQYLDQMALLAGNRDTLKNQLSYFFENNLYNHGNEPDIHVPYLYNKLDAPAATQQKVHEILTKKIIHKYGGNAEFKTPVFERAYNNLPKGFTIEMDEDDGTMGAWYVFSAMGLYPLIVGEPNYELVPPLFNHVTIKLENGKTFTIKCKNRTNKDDVLNKVLLNKITFNKWNLSHEELLNGGVLEFIYDVKN